MSDQPAAMVFELQPVLSGRLLELRPLAVADLDAVYQAARDPLIWELHPEPDRHRPEVFQRYFDGAIASRGAFAVIDRASGRIIGCTRFCNLDVAAGEVEIGWTFLERAYWGGAYNAEMKALMLEHAFRFVERVVFVVGENNVRSRRAVEKLGARLLRRAPRPDESGTWNVVYGLTRTSAPGRTTES